MTKLGHIAIGAAALFVVFVLVGAAGFACTELLDIDRCAAPSAVVAGIFVAIGVALAVFLVRVLSEKKQ